MPLSTHNITGSTFLNHNISLQTLVIAPGRGPEALLWIIVDAFLLVAIVTGNSLSIAIILRTRRRRIRNKKSKVKGPLQRTRSKCSNRKHASEMGPHSSDHKRNGPEEMARNCRRPSRSSCFVLSLAMSDLLVGLAMPFHMTFYIQGADREGSIRQDEGIKLGEIEWTCLLRFILIALACSASACNLLAIAVDRYIAIVYPLHYNRYMNKKVAVAMIISCWVSALALSTVPAYWNRWNTATACELDEIFTPQYITCVIPPLFSTVMVALTILYWRISKEARAKLSTFLGADGKGPPWRRCQSGKTYCPFPSFNDNPKTEKSKIQTAHSNSNTTEGNNSSQPSSQLTSSGLLSQQCITLSQDLQQTGCKSTAIEGNLANYKTEGREEYNENASNFHILYKIEEESDIADDEENLNSISSDTTRTSNENHQILYHEQIIQSQHKGDIPLDSFQEKRLAEQLSETCNTIPQKFSKSFPKIKSLDDQTLPLGDDVSKNHAYQDEKYEIKNSPFSKAEKGNSFDISKCRNKCISKAIKNLKGHFHAVHVCTNVKSLPNYCNASTSHNPQSNSCNINNNPMAGKKEHTSPNVTDVSDYQHPNIVSQKSQQNCHGTDGTISLDQRVEEHYNPADALKTRVNDYQESLKTQEIILSVNALKMTNESPTDNLDDAKEEDENVKTANASRNNNNENELNDPSTGFNLRSRLNVEGTMENSTTHDGDFKIHNIENIAHTKDGDNLEEESSQKPCSHDFPSLSPVQKDKMEHYPSVKRRSSSCTSQDDPRGSTWNIRFPSLTSAGTTVRPLSKSTIVVLLVLGSFLLLWLPYIIVCGLLVNGYHLPYNIYRATFSLAMSNSGLNPIIYGWKNAELKRVFLRFILKKWQACRRKYMREEQMEDPEMDSCNFTDASFGSQNYY